MPVKIAINGFGRIGRLALRNALQYHDIQVVAINDLVPTDNLAYLLKHDSTHGRFNAQISIEGSRLIVNSFPIQTFCEKEIQKLPWKDLEVDYVIEATGIFTSSEQLQAHIDAGAKRVILSSPTKDANIATFVMGVNHTKYCPNKHYIVSNASCTTNCLAPITKVLLDNFGIEEGLMTTVHAITATQPTVDGPSKKDWRGGRGAFQNIIPSATGAAKAVGLCIPEVQGKLTGMAMRVPITDVSVVDLTVKLSTATSYEEICHAMKKASETEMRGILGYCEEELVSSDFIGSHYSAVFDEKAGISLNPTFYKIISWYDNEMGYATRLVDLARYMAFQEQL